MLRKDAIKLIYEKLYDILKKIVKDNDKLNLIPKINDLDIDDILYFVKLKISKYTNNYDDLIKELLNNSNTKIDENKYLQNKELIFKLLNNLVDICNN